VINITTYLFTAVSVELAAENLFPKTEVQRPAGHGGPPKGAGEWIKIAGAAYHHAAEKRKIL